MTAHDEVLALLTESERINRRLWEIHVEQAEKQRQTPQTRTLSTFALREPMQVVPLHGPGAPCCDAYGADRVATHDGSAPEAPTALPFCAEEE